MLFFLSSSKIKKYDYLLKFDWEKLLEIVICKWYNDSNVMMG